MRAPLLARLIAPLVASLVALPAEAMNFTRIETVDLAGDGMRPTQMILGSGPIQPQGLLGIGMFARGHGGLQQRRVPLGRRED